MWLTWPLTSKSTGLILNLMLSCEVKWLTTQTADPDAFAVTYGLWCKRYSEPIPQSHVLAVHDITKNLLWHFSVEPMFMHPAYMLARHWGTYQAAEIYPLWLHANDIPTMQAAHDKNPDLEAYLKDRAKTWSSNYIAADLRVNVWAARVCLDLYGIRTPATAYRPMTRPRAEENYTHNAALVTHLLNSGLTTKEVATELGVTTRFLEADWKDLCIAPAFDRRASAPTAAHAEWLDILRQGITIGGKSHQAVHSISEAARAWGVIYNTAKKRLQLLGWEPYTSVSTLLKPAPEFDQ